ncbi:hypothetical protein ALC53_07912 [Atta colombica]|uniref:Uncharacterized protein n=1 Tax=Atta colombica TaxID=520822 RepID=A0A195BAF5_9HYME|nr:hypothetical protein ALC53_07912 [Atta colombica]
MHVPLQRMLARGTMRDEERRERNSEDGTNITYKKRKEGEGEPNSPVADDFSRPFNTRNKLRALRDERSARRSPQSTRRHPACHCGKSEASSGNREKPLRLINQEITRNAGLRCFFVSSLIGLVPLAA